MPGKQGTSPANMPTAVRKKGGGNTPAKGHLEKALSQNAKKAPGSLMTYMKPNTSVPSAGKK